MKKIVISFFIIFLNVSGMEKVSEIKIPSFGVFSPDGKQVAAYDHKTLLVYHSDTGKVLSDLEQSYIRDKHPFDELQWSPEGKYLCYYNKFASLLYVWNTHNSKLCYAQESNCNSQFAKFSSHGKFMAFTDTDAWIIKETDTGTIHTTMHAVKNYYPSTIEFSDNDQLAALGFRRNGSLAGRVNKAYQFIIDLSNHQTILKKLKSTVAALFCNNDLYVLVGNSNNSTSIYQTQDFCKLHTFNQDITSISSPKRSLSTLFLEVIRKLGFNNFPAYPYQNSNIIVSDDQKKVIIMHAPTDTDSKGSLAVNLVSLIHSKDRQRKELGSIPFYQATQPQFSSTNKHLFIPNGQEIRLFTAHGTLLKTFIAKSGVDTVKFSPDGSHLMLLDPENNTSIYKVNT